MKILMVNKFFRIVGGSDTYCFALSEALEKAGHQVIFLSMKDERNMESQYEKYFVDNIDYKTKSITKKLKYAIKYIYSFEAKKKIAQILDDEKPDIVHLNHVHHQITLSVVKEIEKRNIPMVFTLHDVICVCPNYMMLSHNRICEKCVGGKFYHCFVEKCVKDSRLQSLLATIEAYNYKRMDVYNKIDAYIAPTDFYRKKLSDAHFTNSPIFHLKNLLPINTKYEKLDEREDYILYFGRLYKEKGILTLIKALTLTNNNYKLKIVGEGPLYSEIQKYVSEYNLSDNVDLLGYKTGDELEIIVRKAKCVILPSEWYENGPYAIAEAMSYGTPTIVSNYGGLPEAVEDGVTGFICNPNDPGDLAKKIDMLYSLNRSEYEDMCTNAIKKACKDFSAVEYVNRILNIYSELIEKHKS